MRAIQATTGRKPLCINRKGVTADPEQRLSIATDSFRDMFTAKDIAKLPEIKPTKMEEKFTKEEIEKVRSLKDNKSAGADEFKVEQLKYGLTIVYEEIANILISTRQQEQVNTRKR